VARWNAHAAAGRVLNVDGEVIGGLYAAGNAMGSIMGMTYGGHGGTLGPGLVFGYLAGRHAAARCRRPLSLSWVVTLVMAWFLTHDPG